MLRNVWCWETLIFAVGYGEGAVFAGDAFLSINADFGEVKVILPPGIKAESVNSASFASIRNTSEGNVSVKCKLDCAFGTIVVKNG